MEVGNQGLRGKIKGTKAKEGKKGLRGEIKGAESGCNIKILRENKMRRRKDDGQK